MMTARPSYKLKLHKTYYDKGFFNLGVSVDRFIRPDSGPITVRLGSSKREVPAKVNRDANLNGTPRIMGGAELRNWFHRNCRELESVEVVVESPTVLWIKNLQS